ncbi:MAG: hypothetical protein HC806_09450 [Anaerolineae bacterium]|nr:hypothetical protein [Anaerolineae bacterium]
MDEALRFFRVYEGWVYFLLAIGALLYFRRFLLAWRELRSTIFGLEREQSQTRLNQSAGVLTLLILIAVAEFVVVSFVAPLRPQANPLLTPTIDLLGTSTATLPPSEPVTEAMQEGDSTPTPVPTEDFRQGLCVSGELEITSPEPGERVSGEVVIFGSASASNFGFYKLEIALAQNVNWRTIQAGRTPKTNGDLVPSWDTSTLQSGDYMLRLVVVDNDGNSLPDCRVPITIIPPEE